MDVPIQLERIEPAPGKLFESPEVSFFLEHVSHFISTQGDSQKKKKRGSAAEEVSILLCFCEPFLFLGQTGAPQKTQRRPCLQRTPCLENSIGSTVANWWKSNGQ